MGLIEERRVVLGISKRDFCSRLGIGEVTYWRYVQGGCGIDMGLYIDMLGILGLEIMVYVPVGIKKGV